MDNATLQTVLRQLNHMIAYERDRKDPDKLVRGLIMARAMVRTFVPNELRQVDVVLPKSKAVRDLAERQGIDLTDISLVEPTVRITDHHGFTYDIPWSSFDEVDFVRKD